MKGQGQYFKHIDGLRAVAVLGVLLAHYGIPGVPGGFLGVDVFFVISGYLITRLIIQEKGRTGTFSYRRFYIRRFRRLLPAALFLIGLCFLVFYPVLGTANLSSFLRSIPLSILSLANIGFYREVGYFDTAAEFKPLLHMWSLSVEEQFYLIWPTVLLAVLWVRRFGTGVLIALFVVGVLVAQITVNKDPSAAYFLLPARAFELLAGALLAAFLAPLSPYARPSTLSEKTRGYLALAGIVMIGLSFALMTEESRLPGLLSLVPVLGTVLVIAFGASGVVGKVLSLRPVVWIGLISYSLYLFHWPVQVYFAYRMPIEPSIWLRLSFFPISIALAAISYYLVEERFRKPAPGDSRFGNIPFLATTAGFAALVGFSTYSLFLSTPPSAVLPKGTKVTNVSYAKLPYPGEPEHVIYRFEPTDRPVSRKILLLGDSHAHHLHIGFIQEIVSRGALVDSAELPACPPLFGVSRFYVGEKIRKDRQQNCLNNIQNKEALALQPEYDAVVISARWYSMLEEPPTSRFERDKLTTRAQDEIPSLEDTRDLFESSLAETVSKLKRAGKRVVIFSQVPSLGSDLTQCQSLFPGSDTTTIRKNRCYSLTAEEMQKRAAYTDGVLAEFGKKEGVLTVLPMDLFCDENTCHFTDPDTGIALYQDDNHLSEFGSHKLIKWAIEQRDLLEFLEVPNLEKGMAKIN
ncbi:acyltransferase family protein [Ruegeria meonggei]|uniref:O-acetyltransferase OatA n=1 Tax=Ruegeria meonggei TaxID=1446476 RepID=A0A1X6Y5P0_9RHOB|nr:acyltransferase family protein [Ruegeria meonggei]SLN10738.1 O-acetyltransferase OatA [Ruegeria meonggei]